MIESTSRHEEIPHEIAAEMLQERLHEEQQKVHSKWWLLSLFAAFIPFGLVLSSALTPLGQFMKADPSWVPAIDDSDLALLDGAMIAPSVIMPIVIGIALDAAWSVNLGILFCLIGSVFGQFFVALGLAWHSFGLVLTGRLIGGFCFAPVFVVADTIAAQFNRKRRSTSFGIIGAMQSIGLGMNMLWLPGFTEQALGADYEKANDILLIVSLMCLGVGFLWGPIVSSFELGDAPKQRAWKWHVPTAVWAVAIAQIVTMMYHAGVSTVERELFVFELGSVVVLGPLLGYYLDKTAKSQNGSLSPSRWMLGVTGLVLIANAVHHFWGTGGVLAAAGLGVVNMLIRSIVPQVASRDNLSTAFGFVESGLFIGSIVLSSRIQLTYLSELLCLLVNMVLFTFVIYKVRDKWQQFKETRRPQGAEAGKLGDLTEPLHARGG